VILFDMARLPRFALAGVPQHVVHAVGVGLPSLSESERDPVTAAVAEWRDGRMDQARVRRL
jgi:hypothetical protein